MYQQPQQSQAGYSQNPLNPYGFNNGAGLLGGSLGQFASGYTDYNLPNPANAAMPYMNQIPGMLNNIYAPYMNQGMGQMNNYINSGYSAVNPYMQNGQAAGQTLQGQYGNLINNPTGVMNQIGSTYQSSPGYNWQVQQAQQAANNAAAAGGMAGSQAEQQQIAGTVDQLANQNYWQYVNNGLSQYGMGLQGLQGMYGLGGSLAGQMYGVGGNLTGNMYDTGAQMANNYADNLAQAYLNQAGLAYTGQMNQNQQQGGGMGSMGAGIGGLLSYFGGSGGGGNSGVGGLVSSIGSLF